MRRKQLLSCSRMRDEKRTKQPHRKKIIPSGTLNIHYVRTCVLSIETISKIPVHHKGSYYVSIP